MAAPTSFTTHLPELKSARMARPPSCRAVGKTGKNQATSEMVTTMRNPSTRRSTGFVLLEALIALLIVSLGLLAISKLEGLTVSAAGEARSRSEAVTLAQKKLEQLRNWVTAASFTAGMVTGTSTYSGTNAAYNYAWTISASAAGTLVQ